MAIIVRGEYGGRTWEDQSNGGARNGTGDQSYYTITVSPEFQEIERLRAKARHDEAQALHHAEQKVISKRNIEFAKAMIADGEPIDKIARYTGLTQKVIEALA